jgi:hypothetical protein
MFWAFQAAQMELTCRRHCRVARVRHWPRDVFTWWRSSCVDGPRPSTGPPPPSQLTALQLGLRVVVAMFESGLWSVLLVVALSFDNHRPTQETWQGAMEIAPLKPIVARGIRRRRMRDCLLCPALSYNATFV